MSDVVIKAEQVSKRYRLGTTGTGSLRQDLRHWWTKSVLKKRDEFFTEATTQAPKQYDHIWALRDISFEIKKGEVWGIIGRNGAGKSTLLKILSRIVKPTEGTIKGCGKVSSLLEVGTGFHYELTGKENIYISGSMLGMNKAEIDAKFDEIVAFSGIEQFINTPVKRYSSGMYVRLAFAVAANLDPDILIVDEALAVGDLEFQKKCLTRIKELSQQKGRTVLFVSHNINTVEQLCTKALYLQKGELKKVGAVTDVVNDYLDHTHVVLQKNEHLLAKGVVLEKLQLEISEIKSGSDLPFSITIRTEALPHLTDLSVLIYDSKGTRIGIIDLRPNFHLLQFSDYKLHYKGLIKNLKLVEGKYFFRPACNDQRYTQRFI